MRAALALVLILLAAGCVAPGTTDVGAAGTGADAKASALDAARALMEGVPCEAEVGAQTSANLLAFEQVSVGVETTEMDIREDGIGLFIQAVGGIVVVDLRDPLDQRAIATVEMPGRPLDVKWTATNDGAIVGHSNGNVTLVELTDLENPVVHATLRVAGGQGHSLSSWLFDGVEYVFVSAQSHNAGTHVLRRDGWELTTVGHYRTHDLLSTPLGHHDNTIVVDPLLDNKTFMYVAQGFEGWTVADLSDPTKPKEIGRTLTPEIGPGYTHMIRVDFVGDKRYAVTMMEAGVNTLNVYDATDLTKPVLLARWNADAKRPHIPQHNLQIVGDHLFLAHYTEGVYVFNLTHAYAAGPLMGTLAMKPIARLVVENSPPPSDPWNLVLGFSDVIDVQILDGVLYVSDMEDGVMSVGFGCLQIGDVSARALI